MLKIKSMLAAAVLFSAVSFEAFGGFALEPEWPVLRQGVDRELQKLQDTLDRLIKTLNTNIQTISGELGKCRQEAQRRRAQ